jgi:hypothetical protein
VASGLAHIISRRRTGFIVDFFRIRECGEVEGGVKQDDEAIGLVGDVNHVAVEAGFGLYKHRGCLLKDAVQALT